MYMYRQNPNQGPRKLILNFDQTIGFHVTTGLFEEVGECPLLLIRIGV